MRDWSLARIVWVADRGFSSAENRRYLQRAGGHYIIGEKLRTTSTDVEAALSRQGRYKLVADNMMVKEVKIDDAGDRFVVCHNPEAATRDQAVRDDLITRLTEKIAGSDGLSLAKRAELRGQISTTPGLNRFLRVTPGGLLRIDHAAVKAEQRLDGKYLLRCSDPKLSPADIAAGYKQLLEVERGWRDMKSVLDLRPVYHRLEERIRAHVLLCWLALLLVRIAETTTGRTWPAIRTDLDRLHLVTFTGPAGTFRQTTELTKPQRDLFTALTSTHPRRSSRSPPPNPDPPMPPSRNDIRNDNDRPDDHPATTPCPVCGETFTPIRRQQYCTPACRQAAWRTRHTHRTPTPVITLPPRTPRRDYHHLRMPHLRHPPPRPTVVPRLQPTRATHRPRRPVPTLRRTRRHQRPHRPAPEPQHTPLTSTNPAA